MCAIFSREEFLMFIIFVSFPLLYNGSKVNFSCYVGRIVEWAGLFTAEKSSRVVEKYTFQEIMLIQFYERFCSK
jgi:hypothetical protein